MLENVTLAEAEQAVLDLMTEAAEAVEPGVSGGTVFDARVYGSPSDRRAVMGDDLYYAEVVMPDVTLSDTDPSLTRRRRSFTASCSLFYKYDPSDPPGSYATFRPIADAVINAVQEGSTFAGGHFVEIEASSGFQNIIAEMDSQGRDVCHLLAFSLTVTEKT